MKMKIKGSGNRAWQPQTGKEIIKRERGGDDTIVWVQVKVKVLL